MTDLPRLLVSLLLIAVSPLWLPRSSTPSTAAGAVARSASGAAVQTLTDALQAEREGRVSDAEGGYRSLLGNPDPAIAAQSQLALGRVLERSGRSAEALAPLQAASRWLGTSEAGLQAEFLLGEAEADQRQNKAAAAAFRAYLDAHGPAANYAALEEAWAQQAAGDNRAALAVLLRPLQSTSRMVRVAALAAAGDSLAGLGENRAAAADEQARANLTASASDRADALVQEGRLDYAAGDNHDAVAAFTAVVAAYPALPAAATALDQLDALGAGVNGMQRAVVLFNQHQTSQAQSAFRSVLAGNPSPAIAAEATYYLAALADQANENDAALAGYQSAFQLDPTGARAGDALWGQAQLLQALGRYREAQDIYIELLQRFPSSEHAAESAFDAGLMAYLDGRPDDAAQLWALPARSSDPAEAAESNLWLGKLALAHGDTASAASDFARAQTAQPVGYFGLRAQALAAGSSGDTLAGPAISPAAPADWGQAEAWLTGWAWPEDAAQFQGLEATEDWREAMALEDLGWQTTPTALLLEALEGAQRQPWVLYQAARAFQDRGLTFLALTASDDLLALAPGGLLSAPAAILQLAYPTPYLALVNQDATQSGLDPLLIYALVRQESGFDAAVGSGAGAQGLTQLLPSTAQGVARSLELTLPADSSLSQPAINLRLGSAYLAQQAHTFEGDLDETLAAYNAGAGNATRWAKGTDGDPDLFYEQVDFAETRRYITNVRENYAVYSLLYRSRSHPGQAQP